MPIVTKFVFDLQIRNKQLVKGRGKFNSVHRTQIKLNLKKVTFNRWLPGRVWYTSNMHSAKVYISLTFKAGEVTYFLKLY